MGQAKRRKQQLGAAYGAPPAVVYHYTPEFRIYSICRSGLKNVYYPNPWVWYTSSEEIDETSRLAVGGGVLSLLPGTFATPWRVLVSSEKVEHVRSASLEGFDRMLISDAHPAVTSKWYVSKDIQPSDILGYQKLVAGIWVDADPFEVEEPDFVMEPRVYPKDKNNRTVVDHHVLNSEVITFRQEVGTTSPVVFHHSGFHAIEASALR